MELIPFFPSSLWFLIWLKRWVNAEGEPKGQSCPRQAGGRPALFLWVLFQIAVGFEAEVVSELVPPLAFFTDAHKHTHAALHKPVHLQGSIPMRKMSGLCSLFRAIICCNEASFFSPAATLIILVRKWVFPVEGILMTHINCGSCTDTAWGRRLL